MIRRRRKLRAESEKAVGRGAGEHEQQDRAVGQEEEEEVVVVEKKKVPTTSQQWIIHQDALTPRSVRRPRTRFDEEEVRTLEREFEKEHFPDRSTVLALSKKLGHSVKVIRVWFQNARQREKIMQERQVREAGSVLKGDSEEERQLLSGAKAGTSTVPPSRRRPMGPAEKLLKSGFLTFSGQPPPGSRWGREQQEEEGEEEEEDQQQDQRSITSSSSPGTENQQQKTPSPPLTRYSLSLHPDTTSTKPPASVERLHASWEKPSQVSSTKGTSSSSSTTTTTSSSSSSSSSSSTFATFATAPVAGWQLPPLSQLQTAPSPPSLSPPPPPPQPPPPPPPPPTSFLQVGTSSSNRDGGVSGSGPSPPLARPLPVPLHPDFLQLRRSLTLGPSTGPSSLFPFPWASTPPPPTKTTMTTATTASVRPLSSAVPTASVHQADSNRSIFSSPGTESSSERRRTFPAGEVDPMDAPSREGSPPLKRPRTSSLPGSHRSYASSPSSSSSFSPYSSASSSP